MGVCHSVPSSPSAAPASVPPSNGPDPKTTNETTNQSPNHASAPHSHSVTISGSVYSLRSCDLIVRSPDGRELLLSSPNSQTAESVDEIALARARVRDLERDLAFRDVQLAEKDGELSSLRAARVQSATQIINEAIQLIAANAAHQQQQQNDQAAAASPVSVSLIDSIAISNEELRARLMELFAQFAEKELSSSAPAPSPEPFSRVIARSNLDDKTKKWLMAEFTRDGSEEPSSVRSQRQSLDPSQSQLPGASPSASARKSSASSYLEGVRHVRQNSTFLLANFQSGLLSTNLDSPRLSRSLIESIEFDVLEYTPDELLVHASHIFRAFELPKRFDISPSTLNQFLLCVRSGYGPHSYHNFYHAVDVLHCVYLYTRRSDAIQLAQIRSLDLLALFISALAHDLGHTGTNNLFHIHTKSDLAITYSDQSVLEYYHAAQAFRILQSKEANILSSLSKADWIEARKSIISCILATDMQQHYTMVGKLDALFDRIDKANPQVEETITVSEDGVAVLDSERGAGNSEANRIARGFSQADLGAPPFASVPVSGAVRKATVTRRLSPSPVSRDDILLLLNVLLHSADVSNVTKPWKSSLCFPASDTRVLTNHGFLFLDELQLALQQGKSILYAAYDIQTKSLVYCKGAIHISETPSDSLIRFSGRSQHSDQFAGDDLSIRVTPNHRMFVAGAAQEEPQICLAESLLPVNCPCAKANQQRLPANSSFPISRDQWSAALSLAHMIDLLPQQIEGEQLKHEPIKSKSEGCIDPLRLLPHWDGDLTCQSYFCRLNSQFQSEQGIKLPKKDESELLKLKVELPSSERVHCRQLISEPAEPPSSHSASDCCSVYFTGSAINGVIQRSDAQLDCAAALALTTDDAVIAFLEFYGYWMCFGSLQLRSSGSAPVLALTSNQASDSAWLRCTLQRMGSELQYLEHEQSRGTLFVISDARFVSYFSQFYFVSSSLTSSFNDEHMKIYRPIRFMPWILSNLATTQSRVLLSCLARFSAGRHAEMPSFATYSASLRDEVLHLSLNAGYSGHWKATSASEWLVTWCSSPSSGFRLPRVGCVQREFYCPRRDGVQWCVTVDHPDHLIVAQRTVNAAQCGRPIVIGNSWANKLQEEFQLQGDQEKSLGLPVSPFMDRANPAQATMSLNFIDFIVAPLLAALVQAFPSLVEFANHLIDNRKRWHKLLITSLDEAIEKAASEETREAKENEKKTFRQRAIKFQTTFIQPTKRIGAQVEAAANNGSMSVAGSSAIGVGLERASVASANEAVRRPTRGTLLSTPIEAVEEEPTKEESNQRAAGSGRTSGRASARNSDSIARQEASEQYQHQKQDAGKNEPQQNGSSQHTPATESNSSVTSLTVEVSEVRNRPSALSVSVSESGRTSVAADRPLRPSFVNPIAVSRPSIAAGAARPGSKSSRRYSSSMARKMLQLDDVGVEILSPSSGSSGSQEQEGLNGIRESAQEELADQSNGNQSAVTSSEPPTAALPHTHHQAIAAKLNRQEYGTL